ncbi:MAG: YkgJ family cysteine cluster protein [Candidatus Falkowbacteria bacterium]|nr:YkgJ family cysteine cluster protein [Candidatus Falkowbacteria bacterium]
MLSDDYKQKIKRTLGCVFPISRSRRGACNNCGCCCALPKKCPFLKKNGDKTYCSIYKIRPLNCRKYPRVKSEHLTAADCGYYFEAKD